MKFLLLISISLTLSINIQALLNVAPRQIKSRVTDASFVKPDITNVSEEACIDTANRMERVLVPVPESIHPSGIVGISYVHWPAQGPNIIQTPIVMIHGFDSSCLEYRRLGSRLAAKGVDTYAVDLLGWGFTQLDGVQDFSANAKVRALDNFVSTVIGDKPFCIAGASLGGAAAIEVASENPNCAALVLIDAQGFVDGIGPMASMPTFLANLGVQVLKSVPLRSSANQMSYFDKETYATDEAVAIGRLHCLTDGWSNALVNFMQSGGFSPSSKVPSIKIPTLILWGRQDGILDGKEFAPKFLEAIPGAKLEWIENCGHVPHLERPDDTASITCDFLSSIPVRSSGNVGNNNDDIQRKIILAGAGLTAFAAFAAAYLPVH